MIFFRGWGSLVFFLLFVWLIVAMLAMYQLHLMPAAGAGKVADNVSFWQVLALTLLLHAGGIFLISRYRERVRPGVDSFSGVPMRYWPMLLLILSAVSLGVSFLGANAPSLG